MSIDRRYIELINADIDGEIDVHDKADLEAFLANSEEGRALYEELSRVAGSLNDLPSLDPPVHLQHLLMSRVPSGPKPSPKPAQGFFARLVENPVLGYVGMFAAGVALTLAIVQSDQISSSALDDMTGLVGTVADPEFVAPEHGSLAIDEKEVAGTVRLRSTGSILIVDFDLAAKKPVEIVARYADETIWFNGFAQLESAGTTVAAEAGSVKLLMDGKRRFAVYLNNPGNRPTSIDMQITADGNVVYKSQLNYATVK